MSIKTLVETLIAATVVTASMIFTGSMVLSYDEDFESITEQTQVMKRMQDFKRFHERMNEVRRQGDAIPPLEPDEVQGLMTLDDLTRLTNLYRLPPQPQEGK